MAYNYRGSNGGHSDGARPDFRQRYEQKKSDDTAQHPHHKTSIAKVVMVIGVIITGLATVTELLRQLEKMHGPGPIQR